VTVKENEWEGDSSHHQAIHIPSAGKEVKKKKPVSRKVPTAVQNSTETEEKREHSCGGKTFFLAND